MMGVKEMRRLLSQMGPQAVQDILSCKPTTREAAMFQVKLLQQQVKQRDAQLAQLRSMYEQGQQGQRGRMVVKDMHQRGPQACQVWVEHREAQLRLQFAAQLRGVFGQLQQQMFPLLQQQELHCLKNPPLQLHSTQELTHQMVCDQGDQVQPVQHRAPPRYRQGSPRNPA